MIPMRHQPVAEIKQAVEVMCTGKENYSRNGNRRSKCSDPK